MVRVLFLIQPHLQEKLRELYHFFHISRLFVVEFFDKSIIPIWLIWLFIIINLAGPRRITVNWQLPPLHFSSAKLQIENSFNSIELKQKVTYTSACHTIIELLGNCLFSAKDEKLFLFHQSRGVSLPCWCFWRWLWSHFVSLGDWSTKWRSVVVVTYVTGMRTYSSRII